MWVRKQKSHGNCVEKEQHDKGGAGDGDRLRLPHERGQKKQLGAAHQERRIGEITSHPTRIFPTWLRVGAEQDALVGRRAESGQQSCEHRQYASPLEVESNFRHQAEPRRGGADMRLDRARIPKT